MDVNILTGALTQIIERYGTDVLKDERRTIALLSDFLPNRKRERNALKCLYDSGAMSILIREAERKSNIDYAVMQAAEALKYNSLMDEKIAARLVGAVSQAMGLNSGGETANRKPEKNGTVEPGSKPAPESFEKKRPPVDEVSKPSGKDCGSNTVLIIVSSIIACGIIAVSIISWAIGQWLVGIAVGLLIIYLSFHRIYVSFASYSSQFWINMGLSAVNVGLALMLPAQCSKLAVPVAVGIVIAFLLIHEDWSDRMVGISAAAIALNAVVATSVYGGFDGMFLLWVLVFLLPAVILAFVIRLVLGALVGDNYLLISFVVIGVIILAHALIMFICPDYLNSLYGIPV